MSSIPSPPIRAFYDSDGKIRKDRVYEYLNSLFGATEPNYTRKITFKLPSLAVPAIFNETTQKFSVDGNGIDPNIKPFTLYYFFNDKKNPPHKDYELTTMILFVRQSSTHFLSNESFRRNLSWNDFNTKLSDRFEEIMRGGQIVYTQNIFRIGSRQYPTYKALSPTNPKTRTLNYSETGFQT